jgi:anti-anti-sigma regulatory factor
MSGWRPENARPPDNIRKKYRERHVRTCLTIFSLTPPTLIPIESTDARKEIADQLEELGMGIKNLPEDVILVDLPSQGQQRSEELKAVNEVVSNKNEGDVVVDFSRVEIINSWDISNLLILQNLLTESGHKLILFGMATVTKCIFVVAGLTEAFTFAEDRQSALQAVDKSNSPANSPPKESSCE